MKPNLVITGVVAPLGVAAPALFGFLRRNAVLIESAGGAGTGARAQ